MSLAYFYMLKTYFFVKTDLDKIDFIDTIGLNKVKIVITNNKCKFLT